MLQNAPKDCLTGFYLRDSLHPYLESLIVTDTAQKKNFSLALIDLDRFKKFNDKYGHAFGDEVLKYVTGTMRLTFSEIPCHLFRYGGDEFIAVLPDKDLKETYRLLQRCSYNLAHRPFLFKNKLYKITISCGIAGFPCDAAGAEKLIQMADKAMYFSKRHGRNYIAPVNRIAYLKLRRLFALIASICVIIFSGLLAYRLSFNRLIQPAWSQIKTIRVSAKPEKLDMIILKTGVVCEGRIISETADKVIVELYLEKGQGRVTFNKSEIAQIKHGLVPP